MQYNRMTLGRQAKELGFVRDTFEKVCSMPKSRISYRKPRRISEAKRQQARDAMKKINECG